MCVPFPNCLFRLESDHFFLVSILISMGTLIMFNGKYLFKEYKELLLSMVGKEGPLPLEDYVVIYKNTGIDIDGRLENLKTRVESRVRRVQCYVNFIETIPGFQSLPDIDKAALAGGKYWHVCVIVDVTVATVMGDFSQKV